MHPVFLTKGTTRDFMWNNFDVCTYKGYMLVNHNYVEVIVTDYNPQFPVYSVTIPSIDMDFT